MLTFEKNSSDCKDLNHLDLARLKHSFVSMFITSYS